PGWNRSRRRAPRRSGTRRSWTSGGPLLRPALDPCVDRGARHTEVFGRRVADPREHSAGVAVEAHTDLARPEASLGAPVGERASEGPLDRLWEAEAQIERSFNNLDRVV